MGIKIAGAMGCTVAAISRSPQKAAFATQCGATKFICSGNAAEMAENANSYDLVLNTIPSEHDWTVYSKLVAPGGKHVILGLHTGLVAGIVAGAVTGDRSKVVGSGIGGIEATQAVIDLCAEHQIFPQIKTIAVSEINGVYEQLAGNNDSGLRYVIDIENTLTEDAYATCTAPPPKIPPHEAMSGMSILGAICSFFCCCRCC
jgi:uncharacterized zinc-type alcohol dehydrogenase-like protein